VVKAAAGFRMEQEIVVNKVHSGRSAGRSGSDPIVLSDLRILSPPHLFYKHAVWQALQNLRK
jgi:hypothetical protein